MLFKKRALLALTLPLALFAFSGCGALTQSDAAAKLDITTITTIEQVDEVETTVMEFFANEVRFDSGRDRDLTTTGEGNLDGIPQDFEVVTVPASSDVVKIGLLNTPRLGVKDPINLLVYKVVFTYFDANGNSRPFARQNTQSVSLLLTPDTVGELEVIAVPELMKTVSGGLADIFIFGRSADALYGNIPALEQAAAKTWIVYIDVYAKDVLNKDTVHAQSVSNFTFINPMKETALGLVAPP